MTKFHFVFTALLLFFMIACKNNSTSSTPATDSTKATAKWSKEDEREFLADCVNNAKANLGDTAAFALCKCVLGQVEKSYPNLDSASAVLTDSIKAASYVAACK